MTFAEIGPIAVHFPAKVETNDDLQAIQPGWDMDELGARTGILRRYVAAPDECASDLAVAAAEKLFANHSIERNSIDYVLFCSQAPDCPLPTTACLIQNRLRLRTNIGALDFNLGCSGYVYGLNLADGLIRTGVARRVLLLTGETYTKFIDADDRSLRPIFSDAATATLIEAQPEQSLTAFQMGTDGSGANMLFADGGLRPPQHAIQARGRRRWKSPLYMDGQGIIEFSLTRIPQLVEAVCQAGGIDLAGFDKLLFHQATFKLLDHLRKALNVPPQRMPIRMEHVGNTVSCTLPILIQELRDAGELDPHPWHMLVGFGVGLSWAGCLWRDTWRLRKIDS
ncbi:MAG TPA: ketoacyl-ACP synthase III [Pirellulaceae bacterium]|nr:ketoacyl-ACP synthase III [Pirellulaceae bacterium]